MKEINDCIFCKIVKGQMPIAKIYENSKVIAFLDIRPANKGHCLIIPKIHSNTLTEIKDSDLAAMIVTSKKIAKALSLSIGNQAFNLVMSNGKLAGQEINHAHIHLIPRFRNDCILIKWPHLKYTIKEITEYKEKIKKFI